jgi:hypothetical protein
MMIEKHCPHCDKTLPACDFHKDKRTSSGLRCWCKECVSWKFKHQFLGTDVYKRRLKKYHDNRKTQVAQDPRPQWVTVAMGNAKKRSKESGLEFSITRDDVFSVFPDSCPLLGVRFEFSKGKTTSASPSLDRKDPSIGYTKENVWVICAKANRIKTNATREEIAMVAKALMDAGI